jgi:Rod binding domain-containing protein
MLSESMKSMLEHGKEGQVYGYYLTEALADGITKGGGLGLRSIVESQLRQQAATQPSNTEVQAAAAKLSAEEARQKKLAQ